MSATLRYAPSGPTAADCGPSSSAEWVSAQREHPSQYTPEPGLVHAVQVALTLQKPLLVTGEPGTGKTQLAYHLAWALGLDEPLKYEATSVMEAKDLFYTFDALGRFHAAQDSEQRAEAADYLDFQALGLALVRSLTDPGGLPASLRQRLTSEVRGTRSLVLIDEIDKAPRDVPNDLLNQIEHLYFRIPECRGVRITGDPGHRPVLLFTSNSERFLPDAFLRRCIFYDIPYPSREQLESIVAARLRLARPEMPPLVAECISLIDFLRSPQARLARKPGPAELLDWLEVLVLRGNDLDKPLTDEQEVLVATACTLVKNREDQAALGKLVHRWREVRATTPGV